jgi:hypothetical protein
MIRAVVFFIVVASIVSAPVPVFVVLLIVYMYRYTAYELIVIAACIDAFFGWSVVPYYLVGTTVAIVLMEWVKPRLRVVS